MIGSGEQAAAGSLPVPAVLKITLGYDGTGFWGSQKQAGVRTVQQELDGALERLADCAVATELAGRTDRGVHAVGQVARCADIRPEMTGEAFRNALSRLTPDDLAVSSVTRVEAGFHPRYDATWREYRYRLWVGAKQPLMERFAWTRRSALDLEAMTKASIRLEGTHDLAAFTGGGEGVPWSARASATRGTVRTIHHCGVREVGPWWGILPGSGTGIEVRIIADGFLPQLVRTVTGGLVSVGMREHPPEWFTELLEVADRRSGPVLAPAHGLILWRVGYGNDVPEPDPNGKQTVSITPAHTEHG
ncbi:MAG: tRNA pseudouridine synthase A [Chloroflexota bacterium]|nr:tRNA pseudouridine synthase A [Chloroflexota bacterium]